MPEKRLQTYRRNIWFRLFPFSFLYPFLYCWSVINASSDKTELIIYYSGLILIFSLLVLNSFRPYLEVKKDRFILYRSSNTRQYQIFFFRDISKFKSYHFFTILTLKGRSLILFPTRTGLKALRSGAAGEQ